MNAVYDIFIHIMKGSEIHGNTCHRCFISIELEQTSLEDSQNIVPPRKGTQRDARANQVKPATKPQALEIPWLKKALPGSHSSPGLKGSSQILARHDPSAFQLLSQDPNL